MINDAIIVGESFGCMRTVALLNKFPVLHMSSKQVMWKNPNTSVSVIDFLEVKFEVQPEAAGEKKSLTYDFSKCTNVGIV